MAKQRQQQIIIVGQEAPKQRETLPEPNRPMISFDSWWGQAQNKYNFRSSMKEVLKKHFEARGFMASSDFEAGLKDFGY